MKTVIRVVVLSLALVFSSASAQDFKGVATYKTQRAVDIKIDSSSNPNMTSDLQKQMSEMLKKQFQKTYTLTFDKESSIYKEDESLAPPQVGGNGMQVMTIGIGGGSDILYKNTKTNTYSEKKDTMGKIFLVKDDLESIDWQLGSETKYIGNYQCFKATFTKMVPKPVDLKTFGKSQEEDKEPELEERTVTAWYTPQIPVNNGPAKYQGLPGLILEVHDGKLNIVCSKIVINPEDAIDIKEPTKGKKVNQAEYEKIMDAKQKEMLERFKPQRGNRDGESIHIRIGG
ncbi:GLPGLI family protein [Winogradskyella wandonensis]|uniref:GLPGLI family protein n=1 Tax=Winogradskyella wandonensis TaxID=1442586 RepID=A0A4R1KQY5_9FLAO|nr:GLPGLI family protein [Winogradskyella wandonensis]TCK67475.1 GLPGLI family protein [Winogradskyella wandonensis]